MLLLSISNGLVLTLNSVTMDPMKRGVLNMIESVIDTVFRREPNIPAILWHMIKVTKSTINPQWCKNELHFHFTCARAGLEEKARDVNQLLAIVRRETNIGSEEKQLILTAIGEGEGG